MKKKESIPFSRRYFPKNGKLGANNGQGMAMTYVCTGIEALRTVSGVQKEGLVALNEAELIAKTLDLYMF